MRTWKIALTNKDSTQAETVCSSTAFSNFCDESANEVAIATLKENLDL